jgi:hypothetical protein
MSIPPAPAALVLSVVAASLASSAFAAGIGPDHHRARVAQLAASPASSSADAGDRSASGSAGGREDASAWFAQYAVAKRLMVEGAFPAAATRFEALIQSAPDLGSRILATEMATTCRTWAQGGLVLTTPQKLKLAAPAALEDRRTTDEIAILYTNAVLYGLYAGVVVDTWTKANSPGSALLPPLAFAGLSAGVVAMLDRNVHLGYGVAQSIVSGMYIGFEEGIAWALWHEAHVPGASEWGGRAVTSLILATGTVGAIVGGVVGATYGTTPGRAALMGSGAMWGGLVAGTLAGGIDESDDAGLLSAALALNAGAIAGGLLGAAVSPSIARVRFIDLGGLSGGLLVGGLYWAQRDREAGARGLLVATSLGMGAGLVASWLLTEDMEPDLPRKHRETTLSERLVPTLAPTANGAGFVLGVASTL